MHFNMIRKDFSKNILSNFILFLFISSSISIITTVFLTISCLFSSISSFYDIAKPPHFLQMHKGKLNQEEIDKFNEGYSGIIHWQTVPMINIYGDEVTVSGRKTFSLHESRLDIGLVKQNSEYDLLLDENRYKAAVKKGEIGIPVILLGQFNISKGDRVTIDTGGIKKDFIVSQFIYDAQMNSTLVSSTRFLMSDEDFDELFSGNIEKEYLIEAYLENPYMAANYQNAYEQSTPPLPKNGQAVTYTMIFLISAMTGIMTAVIYLITGILLIAVCLICLKYTVLSQLEKDIRGIGTMKAIGIASKDIMRLYLWKIRILSLSGSIAGFLIGIFLTSLFTENISRTLGKQDISLRYYFYAAIACSLIYSVIILFSRKVLKCIDKVTVVDLLIREKGFSKEEGRKKPGTIGWLPLNLFITLRKMGKGYLIILYLFIIVTFFVTMPFSMKNTLSNKEFITYMGNPVSDIMLEVEQGKDIEERKEKAERLLSENSGNKMKISYDILRRVRLQTITDKGNIIGIYIDIGDSSGKGIKYLSGENPKRNNEIALSFLVAEDLGKTVGDNVTLTSEGKKYTFKISGIYQDITSGGKTGKMIHGFSDSPAQKYIFHINTGVPHTIEIARNWRNGLGGGYSIESTEEFTGQVLGEVISKIDSIALYTMSGGVFLIVLILSLFMKLEITARAKELTTKSILGFTFRDIFLQELYPLIFYGGTGITAGLLCVSLIGNKVLSLFFSIVDLGIKKIELIPFSLFEYTVIPLFLLITLIITVIISCLSIRRLKISDYINE